MRANNKTKAPDASPRKVPRNYPPSSSKIPPAFARLKQTGLNEAKIIVEVAS